MLQVETLETFDQRALRLLQLVVVLLKTLELHPVRFHMLSDLNLLQLFGLSFILLEFLVELRIKVLCELDLFILLPHILFLQESYFGRDALLDVFQLLIVFEFGLEEFLSELCEQLIFETGRDSQLLLDALVEIPTAVVILKRTPHCVRILFDDHELSHDEVGIHLVKVDKLIAILAQPLKLVELLAQCRHLLLTFQQNSVEPVLEFFLLVVPGLSHRLFKSLRQIHKAGVDILVFFGEVFALDKLLLHTEDVLDKADATLTQTIKSLVTLFEILDGTLLTCVHFLKVCSSLLFQLLVFLSESGDYFFVGNDDFLQVFEFLHTS